MTGVPWSRVASILDDALARPAAERDAYVDRACAGDARLGAEVRSLLTAHDRAGDFLDEPAYESLSDLLAGTDDAEGEPPERIGPYLVRGRLGAGGMGVVYLAEDTRLARRVALKAITPGRGDHAAWRDRLRQEARAAAALTHPNVATVYALEDIDGQLYLASEYVPGRTLREIGALGLLPFDQARAIAVQLADALSAAHGHGVVHGDLKPDNVVVTPSGTVKVLDFGLAHIDGQPGTVPTGGTPGYMAPEQRRGAPADHRSDQFAFGLIVRELTGDAEAGAPPGLGAIVERCLRLDPEERYGSSAELAAAVRDLEGRRVGARSPSWSARRWWTIHQGVTCAVYLLALAPLWLERDAMPRGAGVPVALAGLALAVVATSIRLNLWFSTRVLPAEAAAHRVRVRGWRRACDSALAALLAGAALATGDARPYSVTLMVALGAGLAVSSLVIEPTTERAAFGRPRPARDLQ